ncbi:MAG: hypothetical protein LUD81_02885 [Clostridiales bacterium]|nr:hypothetical protein [Clostridiales bacterium]
MTITNVKNSWLNETKAKFKKGDRVIAEIYFGDYLNDDFGGKYKRSFRGHEVYNGAVKPDKEGKIFEEKQR